MPSLDRISVTPVKGTALQHPERVRLAADGIAGNRRFHLIDESGALVSGDTLGDLVRVRTAYEAETGRLRCVFPDGATAEGPADASGNPVVTDFYGRPAPGTVLEGPFAEAFSAFARRPLRLVRLDREGDGPDVHRLSLVSFASVADLGHRGGDDRLDGRRFRMNLELGGCEPYEEDEWDGRRVRIGDAVVRLRGQVPRCRFTTLSPATGEKDFETLKLIASYRPLLEPPDRGIPFGMYAEVENPADVAVGDPVVPE
ncbi:MAG TPA: MOSC domain-containing protein [Actinomycetota bacterium]